MDLLINFDDLKQGDRALRKLTQAFARAGAPVVSAEIGDKPKRTSGVTYREVFLAFADSQQVVLSVKTTGDIWQVKLNGSVVPLRNQDDHKKAVSELVQKLEAGRAKFQAKLAKQGTELPKGVRATTPRIEVALQKRSDELDGQIAEARKTIEGLRAELGEAA